MSTGLDVTFIAHTRTACPAFVGSENRIVWTHWKWPSNTRIHNFENTHGNKTCSIFIRHSSRKMKDVDKFCMISLWSFWRQIEDSLLVLKIGSCEHTTNDLPIFSPQKRNLKIGPSERLLAIFGTRNRILKIGSCERSFKPNDLCILLLYDNDQFDTVANRAIIEGNWAISTSNYTVCRAITD